MNSVEKKLTPLLSKIEETIESYLPTNTLTPLDLDRTIKLEKKHDSSGAQELKLTKPLYSWPLKDLMSSETKFLGFLDQMVTQCTNNINIITEIHEQVENQFPDDSDLFINESFFIYEETRSSKDASRIDSTLKMNLVLTITE